MGYAGFGGGGSGGCEVSRGKVKEGRDGGNGPGGGGADRVRKGFRLLRGRPGFRELVNLVARCLRGMAAVLASRRVRGEERECVQECRRVGCVCV